MRDYRAGLWKRIRHTTHVRSDVPPQAPARRTDRRRIARCEELESRTLMAVRILFDYSLDARGFFQAPERRNALEFAGNRLGARLNDSLSAIQPRGGNAWMGTVANPSTGRNFSFVNRVLPANTILVFVGGRALPGGTLAESMGGGFASFGTPAWNNTVLTRGQPGVANRTDVAPWGGALSFSSNANWSFSTTTFSASPSQNDFVSVAMHELGHVLGVASSNPSFRRLVSGSQFVGQNTRIAQGFQAAWLSPDGSHFREGTTSSDGREAAMDPSLTVGSRKFFTTVDFAMLKDIGWQVAAGAGVGVQVVRARQAPSPVKVIATSR